MNFRTFGFFICVAAVGLPLATAEAGPHTTVSTSVDGEPASRTFGDGPVTPRADRGSPENLTRGDSRRAAGVRNRFSRSFQGDTESLDEAVVEDSLASTAGGELSPATIKRLEAAKPIMGPGGTESIIGRDTRRKVGNTKSFPNRAVVLILFDTPSGSSRCTGWLINKNTVATAGHCVYDPGVGFYPRSSYELIPAYTGSSAPYGSCGARTLYTVRGWAYKGKDQNDYGAIKLDCNIGKQTGWFGYYWTSKNWKLKGKKVKITGFPGDKPLTMWKSKGRVKKVQRKRVFYKNDTTGGMSGSPVWHKKRKCGKCSMAIHAYGTYGNPPFSKYNHGTRITRKVFRKLRKWKRD